MIKQRPKTKQEKHRTYHGSINLANQSPRQASTGGGEHGLLPEGAEKKTTVGTES